MKIFKMYISTFICILILALSGCGKSTTPLNKAQLRAVEIGNQFLDYEITTAEAIEQLESIAIPDPDGGGSYLSTDIDYLVLLLTDDDIDYEAVKELVKSIESENYDILKHDESNLSLDNENSNDEKNVKTDTFDVDKQSVINLFAETGKYIETNVDEFDDNERHIFGTILLNPNDFEKDFETLLDEECIDTEIIAFSDKVFDISLTYVISGDEMHYEKLSQLSKKILSLLKPTIEKTFFDQLDKFSDDFYSNDFENLRCSVSFEELRENETSVNIRIVHLE